MKKVISLTSAALCVFMLFSCSYDNTTDPNINIDPIMPLKVGNSWTYNCHYLTEDCIDKAVVTGTTILEVDGRHSLVVVVTWYTLTNGEWIEDDIHYYKNEFKGLYRYYENKKELIVKYPIEVHETWSLPGETEDWGNGIVGIISWPRTYECLQKGREIETPAGTFNCIKYVETSPFYMYPTYSYYFPGVGLIKSSCGYTYRELIEYYIQEG